MDSDDAAAAAAVLSIKRFIAALVAV